MNWYPGNYKGFGVLESRIFVFESGQTAIAILAQDIDAERADPIVTACGLRPVGNNGQCWCVAPLLTGFHGEPPFPNACFSTIEQVEAYLSDWTPEQESQVPEQPQDSTPPISEDEFYDFVSWLETGATLPDA